MDILNKRFGKLTVVEKLDKFDNSKKRFYLCRCDCGNYKEVVRNSLVTGNTRSCGCLHKESAIRNTSLIKNRKILPFGESAFTALYSNYKKIALIRGLKFELTDNEFRFLVKSDCFYCGIEPKQTKSLHRGNGYFLYNGIDRVNNSIGYTLDNCVPCCKTCNYAKRNMDQSEFMEYLYRIARKYA